MSSMRNQVKSGDRSGKKSNTLRLWHCLRQAIEDKHLLVTEGGGRMRSAGRSSILAWAFTSSVVSASVRSVRSGSTMLSTFCPGIGSSRLRSRLSDAMVSLYNRKCLSPEKLLQFFSSATRRTCPRSLQAASSAAKNPPGGLVISPNT